MPDDSRYHANDNEWSMILYIIRHAQSTNNALADASQRICDPGLTPLGLRQAEALARHLAQGMGYGSWNGEQGQTEASPYAITRLFSSPMRRALQTARPVAAALGLAPEIWLETHEHGGIFLDHGPEGGVVGYPGLTRAEMQLECPGCVPPDGAGEWGWWAGGREERAACEARAARVATTLSSWAASDARIALVSHGDFIDALLRALLGLLPGHGVYFLSHNASISRLNFRADGHVQVGYLNSVRHLPPELVT